MEPFNYGDQNENMNGQLKCDRWLSKRSAAIDADWRGVDQINLMIATIKVIDVYCTNDYIQRLLM